MSTAAEAAAEPLVDSSSPNDYSLHLMRLEFRESLSEVFSEASREEEVSALIPLNHLVGFRVFPSEGPEGGDGRFIFGPKPIEPAPAHKDDNPDRLLSKSLYFSWPFSLAVKTGYLRRAVESLRKSHGFAGVIFRILLHGKGIDLSGEGEWAVFFDLLPSEKTLLFRNPKCSDLDQMDHALAKESFSRVRQELEGIKEYVDYGVKGLILGKTWFDLGSPSYSPNLVFSMSVFNSSFLSIQDYHPFSSPGLGFIGKIEDRYENDPETIRSFTFSRPPIPLLVLEFSASGRKQDKPIFDSPRPHF
jgi:hypothetical protein